MKLFFFFVRFIQISNVQSRLRSGECDIIQIQIIRHYLRRLNHRIMLESFDFRRLFTVQQRRATFDFYIVFLFVLIRISHRNMRENNNRKFQTFAFVYGHYRHGIVAFGQLYRRFIATLFVLFKKELQIGTIT